MRQENWGMRLCHCAPASGYVDPFFSLLLVVEWKPRKKFRRLDVGFRSRTHRPHDKSTGASIHWPAALAECCAGDFRVPSLEKRGGQPPSLRAVDALVDCSEATKGLERQQGELLTARPS